MAKPYTDKIESVIANQIEDEANVTGELSHIHHESPYLFLVFADGRWAVFTLIRAQDGTATDLYQFTPDLSYLYTAGLLTEQDRTEQREHERQEAEKELETRELAELARLKAKYESK